MKTVLLFAAVLTGAAVPPDVNFQPFLDFTLEVFKDLCKQEDGNFVLSVRSLVEQLVILQEVSSQDIPALPHNNQDVYLSIFSQVAGSVSTSAAVFSESAVDLPEEMSTTLAERLGADVLPLATLSSWLRQYANTDTGADLWSSDFGDDGGATLAATESFDGRWEAPAGGSLEVHTGPGPTVMMGHFPVLLSDKLAADFLQLPLQGGRLWLTLGLPKQHSSVQQLADSLRVWPTDDELRLFEPRAAIVPVPGLHLYSRLDLTRALVSAGVNSLDISEKQPANTTVDSQLMVGKVLQWTNFNLAEDAIDGGTSVDKTAAPVDEGSWLQFRVDRPFLFLVSSHGFKVPLFLGKVVSP